MTPLSIYVHWPFCKSKCPYCDFNSHVRASVEEDRWQKALLRELKHYAALLPDRRIESVFFGGGTPSLMQAETVKALLDAIGQAWDTGKEIEITLEANPTSVEARKFQAFRAAGVNRVSLGVQALDAQSLAFLGRRHSASEALDAVRLAADLFPRYSFDLIYARPGQTLAAWEKELTRALSFARGHLSLYQLTIEENTAFYSAQARGEFELPDEETAARLYELTEAITRAHGLRPYEISNYAFPGEESRHNLNYWRGGDYIGIGPGAHGRYSIRGRAAPDSAESPLRGRREELLHDDRREVLQRLATENVKSPERWLEAVERDGQGLAQVTPLGERERREEAVLMGLRLTSGIRYDEWEARTGLKLRGAFRADILDRLQSEALIESDAAHVRASAKGRLLLNGVTRALLAA